MEPAHPSEEKKSHTRLYFGIATGLLFLMALVWSIDASFVYILSGAILIFGLLGFRDSDLVQRLKTETTSSFRKPDTFQPQTRASSGNGFKQVRTARILKPLVIATSVGIFVSVIIFIVVIVSHDNPGYDSQFLYEEAENFYNQGNYDSAAIYYRRVVVLATENEEALTGYGNALMMRGQYDSAIFYYDKALAADPSYDKATYQKGAVLSYQKNYKHSTALMKDLLEENPSYADALQLVGDNYYNQQQYDSALGWYNKAYENGVRNRYLFHLMGYIHETKGDNTSAVRLYQEALQYDSSVLDLYQRLGALLSGQSGNFYRKKAAELEQEIN